jgi:N-acetylmuramoyl-L-alanine amidase
VRPSLPATVLLALLVAPASHAGQRATASAGDLYAAAVSREQALRTAADKGGASLRDYRAVVNAFEVVVRKHPTSGYVDNALWRGAAVAREAFERFGDDRDRATARRMLALLVSDYPVSPYVPKARDLVSRLEPAAAASERPNPPPQASAPAPPPPTKPAPSPAPAQAPLRGPVSLARQLGLGAARIVIDPGHGGHDPGALGEGVSEANVVLDVALRLEALLAAAGVDVILTRRSDEFIPLDKRTAIATREQADLFLSIHANASRVQSARGVETYVLNFATDSNAEAVAARENASTEHTISNLPDIVRAIALHSKLDESRSLAGLVQRTLVAQLRPANRALVDHGVKQAPFVVLVGAEMPSVLAEVAFMTNPQEARLLNTEAYRQRIAQALFDAVRGYQHSLKSAAVLPGR